MPYSPLSPFKRPLTPAHLRLVETASKPLPDRAVSKWQILRDLSKAQAAFGLTDRDLTVLQGLLSFHPKEALGDGPGMIVFASNKALCERLHGMACSTMRRHLARLVDAGLLLRRDSPNGKRYARGPAETRVAYGLDLTPLLCRADEIAEAARLVLEAEERVRSLREAVSLLRRDLLALAALGEELQPGLGLWDQLRDAAQLTARALRRKLGEADLEEMGQALTELAEAGKDLVGREMTADSSINDVEIEQHHQRFNKETYEKEDCCERVAQAPTIPPDPEPEVRGQRQDSAEPPTSPPYPPEVPLPLVLETCPELESFHPEPVRNWHQLHDAASRLRAAMGISPTVWSEAQAVMGPARAAVVVVALLQRFSEIRSAGAYLRALTRKAHRGEFSCRPMIMALAARRMAA